MFQHIKLSARIGFGFLVALLLMAFTGIHGLNNLQEANLSLKSVYEDRVIPLKGLKNIADAYAVSVIDAVNKANAGVIGAEDALRSTQEADRLIEKEWHAYKDVDLSEQEKKLAEEAETLFAAADQDIRRLEALLATKHGNIAGQLAAFDGPLYAHLDPIGGKINALIDLQLQTAERLYRKTAVQYIETVRMTTGMLVVAVLVSALLGFLITRSLKRQFGGEPDFVVSLANKIAVGDLTAQIQLQAGDNNSVMAAMQRMVLAIRALVNDMDVLSQAAVAGRLAARADTLRHQGDYRKIVEGVNATLNAVVEPLNVAADYVDHIAKGEIPAKIVASYSGDFNIIKDNLNTCIEAIDALVADASMLSQAAVEGRLQIRADVSKHRGDFHKIVQGVNATLDNVIMPLNEAVEVLAAAEQGDLKRRVQGHYQGELADFKDSLNNTMLKLAETLAEVMAASEQLGNAAAQVNATSQALAQATSEQASSVEQTSASIEQMSASINQNAESAKITDDMAEKASSEASQGGEAVKQTVEAMKNIAAKIGIVNDIAYQTNMLALNAAIEAARAGDQGKGFAVVATEVRKLAERSQVAAQEIGELAASSVNTAETAGDYLAAIVSSIVKTSDLVQEISAASHEQSVGVNQVNQAMAQMNQITQQNAAVSEELAATAEEMSEQALNLQTLMGFFDIDHHKSVSGHASRKTKPKTERPIHLADGEFAHF